MVWLQVSVLAIVAIGTLNWKVLPFVWHLKVFKAIYDAFSSNLLLPKPGQQFAEFITPSRSPFGECDLYMHKSNSTYFSDLDVARAKLLANVFRPAWVFYQQQGEVPPHPILGGVVCLFKKEIPLYQRYEIRSRILCWDRKWLWIVSHFVETGHTAGRPRGLYASCLSKLVFKQKGRTIPPEEIFKNAGYLPPGYQATKKQPWAAPNCRSSNTDPAPPSRSKRSGDWGSAEIEEERLIGCDCAFFMESLDSLHHKLIPNEA
ncbi:hypothetical protein NA57DRAFT_78556 [Rhizodiscina lignyota]|uniref:Thioesterase n=1 Tax=Rhizodiscina lignyota TaxID=1504668 RepID=A0A9P4I872_9PEZI|nr:hypothetical protein NA57DRAFT_78556 [Rhizodiscina lignyota]